MNTGIRRSLNMLITKRGIDSNIYRYVKEHSDTCYWCGGDLNDLKVHIDHVIASSRNGADQLDNLVAACSKCNEKKHAKDPMIFAAEIGKDLGEVGAFLDYQSGTKTKRATIIYVERYDLDAYIFKGFDREIAVGLKAEKVRFYPLSRGFRAFTAPRYLEQYMRKRMSEFNYDLLDRR